MGKRRSSYDEDFWQRYRPSGPIEVEDGIVAKSQRGRFVENWWADRWIEALTGLMDSGRLSRGRRYARLGQVLEIDIEPGKVSARVQGSRRTPYRVKIWLEPLSDAQWEQVFDALAEQAIYAAQLLSGEMPPDIEEAFLALDMPLFPTQRDDLETECSCPDWTNPCKHIAAVSYLLGERFDEDPFLLFELRGRSKGEVAAALRQRRIEGDAALQEAQGPYRLEAVEPAEAASLEDCLDGYWKLGEEIEETTFRLRPPQVHMALLKRLGEPDFCRASSFWPQMERVYAGVTARALEAAFADAGEGRGGRDREQLAVLTMVQQGKISAQEAETLLEALEP